MEHITVEQIGHFLAIITGIIGSVEFLYLRLNKKLKQKIVDCTKAQNDSQNEALKCLLRSQITGIYYVYKELNEVPEYVRQNMTYMYEQYKKMGGNSYIDVIYEDFMKLPIKK